MERLNKFLAHAGVGSRRHCDALIAAGRVKIDGQRVSDLGVRVDPDKHKVTVDDSQVRAEKSVYWAVHKPPGYLCTNHDPAGRPKAADLLPAAVDQRVYTVGRLDEGSEGLLLMTNDGELAFGLMHPRYGVDKTYLALVAGKPTPDDLRKLVEGVWLSDGKAKAKSARRVRAQGNGTWLRVVLNEGKNREIRRILAKLGHKVLRLRRIAIGPVELDKLPKGKARKLSLPEIQELKKEVEAGQKRIEQKLKTARGEKVEPGSGQVVTRKLADPGRPPGRSPVGPRPGPRRPTAGKPSLPGRSRNYHA